MIGDGVKLDNQIQIGHNVVIGRAYGDRRPAAGISGSTRIGARCIIGGEVSVAGHITIADDVVISGGARSRSSITEPGVYGGAMPADDVRRWRKNVGALRPAGRARTPACGSSRNCHAQAGAGVTRDTPDGHHFPGGRTRRGRHRLGPYSVIGAGVRIGRGHDDRPPMWSSRDRRPSARDNRIFQFASIGDDPQDKKYAGEDTRLEIGDGNTIREYCTINRGTAQDEGVTRVGNDNWLMAYTHIAHDCQVGDDVIMSNNATLAGHVHVEDHAILQRFLAPCTSSAESAAHSFVGGLCGITRDVLPFMMVAGHAAGAARHQPGRTRSGVASRPSRCAISRRRTGFCTGPACAWSRRASSWARSRRDQPEVTVDRRVLDRSERSIVR